MATKIFPIVLGNIANIFLSEKVKISSSESDILMK